MSTKPLNYSAVFVEYFSGDYLINAIKSLVRQTHLPEKIVVVVNGIEDSRMEELVSTFPDVHVIDPNANLGYSKGVNLGTSNTTSEVVAVLNPDLEMEPGCAMAACLYLAQNPQVGSVGPKILDADGEVYPSARNEPSTKDAIGHALLGLFKPNNPFTRRYKNLDIDTEVIRDVDWLSGAAQFIRRSALDEVGGWDEDFFMYCEDVELGRQLRIHGFRSVYVPEAVLTHVQGGSSKATPIKLLVIHHKSLYKFSKKKYKNNFFMRVATALFIGIRLPLAIIASKISVK